MNESEVVAIAHYVATIVTALVFTTIMAALTATNALPVPASLTANLTT
jgi:hypothetical protein